jgi:hypothetical protein
VRTAISLPTRISGRISANDGRAQPARRCTWTNARPMPTCAITVPQAEPARPQSEAVDEQHLERGVDDVGDHEDHQRRLEVRDPAQVAPARPPRA